MYERKFEILGELSVRLGVSKSSGELCQVDSLLEQLNNHIALYFITYECEGKKM